MKKIIPSFLLAISASSSFFLAQGNARRVESTMNYNNNQVTGDRLQGTGYISEELESRAINEGEYNFLNNQVSLLEGDSVPIFHLPSSISYLGMMPKSMMDPAELKNLEEGVESLRGAFGLSGESSASSQVVVNSAASLHSSVESGCKYSVNPSVEYAKGSTDNQSDPSNLNQHLNQPIAYSLQPTASIRPVDRIVMSSSSSETIAGEGKRGNEGDNYNIEDRFLAIAKKIEVAQQAFKEKRGGENSYLWDRIVTKLEQSRDSWNKANELVGLGKEERASLWRKAAEESAASVEEMGKTVQAYISGQEKAAEQLKKEAWNVYFLSDISTWLLKSEEALEKANQMQDKDSDFWKSLAKQYRVAAGFRQDALKANKLEKINEWIPWGKVGYSAHSSADYQAKAAEAEKAGKTMLAEGYREAAATSQRAADQWKLSAERHSVGKESEGRSWGSEGTSLQAKADYQAKAAEAQEAGKIMIAEGYREAAATSQRAADQYKLEAQSKALGKESEGRSWGWEGSSLQAKAHYQAKAAEAQEAGKTMLAEGYREAAATSQRAADQWKLSAQTKAAGRESEGVSWGWEGTSLQAKADYQAKAATAQEAGRSMLAESYREAAEISQRAADQWKLSAERYSVGKENEGVTLGFEGKSLQKKSDYQAKAAEAQEAGQTMLTEGYREAAQISQRAADQWKLSAQTKAAGRESEGVNWGWEGTSLQAKADYHAKAAEVQEAEKITLAEGYREAAATSQRAADQYKLEAQSKALGKESEGRSWGWEGSSLQAKADYQAKAAEAQDAGKTMLAEGYREAAATSQRAADQWKLSAQTKAAGRESEGVSWGWEGTSLQAKADYQAKAATAQEAGRSMLAEGYREAAEISQRAADQWKLSAERYSVGKENEGVTLGFEGKSLQKKSDYQAKAAEAQEAGKTMLAEGYREAAQISQGAADQWKLSAQTKAAGRESEGVNWGWEGTSLQAKADCQAKAAEAQEAGKIMIAEGYREAAQISQRAADEWKLSAERHSVGKESEGVNWGWEGTSLQAKADYQAKAAEAQEAGKVQLAEGYREAAEILQHAIEELKQSVLAKVLGTDEDNCWYNAGCERYKGAEKLGKAIIAEAAGESKVAQAWREAAKQNYLSVDSYTKAATIFATGKLNRTLFNRAYSDADSVTEVTGQFLAEDEEINNSNAEGCRWYFAGKGYYNAAGKIEQAIQAEASGNSKLAQAWNKVAEISQFSSESYTKGAIAYAQRKTDEANSWNNAGYIYELAAEQLNKAIETRERKNTDLAEKHQQAAEKLEQAANLMKRFAETDADNNGTERIRLYQEVKTIINVLIQSSASF